MAFRRRRRPAVTWLPHIQFEDQEPLIGFIQSTVTVAVASRAITTNIYSLVMDQPEEANRANIPSLADFEGSAYRLRRIVGKCFVTMDNDQAAAQAKRPVAALVGAGIIVLRCDSGSGAPLNAGTPTNYSPIVLDNTADPWVWRRTWVLNNDFSNQAAAVQNFYQYPRTNAEYGSIQDGPHIDQKTARRVSKEERLFFVISTCNIGPAADAGNPGFINFLLDYRILASPLKAMGNRRNASR